VTGSVEVCRYNGIVNNFCNFVKERFMQRFGEKLSILRKRQGITQVQLAQQIGIARSYIGELESGKRNNPSANFAVIVADFFGVSLDVLMRDELDLDADDGSS
jgi:transcriptional regulator with XRE-family HTH domain